MDFQTVDEASADARRSAERERPVDRVLELLVERLGGRTGARTVYGDPVERDQVTVIPVARVRWMIGAGAGSGGVPTEGGRPTEGEGSGGGGAIVGDPVGYIEVRPSGATFTAIRGVPNPLAILAMGVSLALVLRAVARLLGR